MEDGSQILVIASQVAMGLSLAACAGLRAFLPLFVVGLAGRLDWVPLTSHFEWLEATPALIVFGVAVAAELLADKVPWLDNALDALQSFVKPIAGILSAAAVLEGLTPLQRVVLAIVLGGGAASVVHFSKAHLRLLSTVTTGGLANPAISAVEDTGAGGLAIAAIWAPLVALAAIVLLAILTIWFLYKRRAGWRPLRPA